MTSRICRWDGRDGDAKGVASGIYIARLVTEDDVRTRKMTLFEVGGRSV